MPFDVLTGDDAKKFMEQVIAEHKEYEKAHPHLYDKYGYKWNDKSKYKWDLTDKDMAPSSDNRYEETYRFMVSMGLEWLDKNKHEADNGTEPKFARIKNVAGIATPINVLGEELRKYLLWKLEDYFGKEVGGCSGFQFQYAMQTIGWVLAHSWEAQLEAMRKHREEKNKK